MSFERQLEQLVQDEIRRSVKGAPQRTADRLAGMTADLSNALAFVIAFGVRGDTKAADTLLTGTQAHLAETVAAKCVAMRAMNGKPNV